MNVISMTTFSAMTLFICATVLLCYAAYLMVNAGAFWAPVILMCIAFFAGLFGIVMVSWTEQKTREGKTEGTKA